MRKFIIKILTNSIAILLILIMLFVLITNYLKKVNITRVSLDNKSLIMGHSHPECAYNDLIINSTNNFSASAEAYFYTLQKLRFLVSQPHKINDVYLEFTNNQINIKMNDWIYGDEYITNKAPNLMQFMTIDDHLVLIRNNFEGYLNSISIYFRESIFKIITQKLDYTSSLGGYLKLEKKIAKNSSKKSNIQPNLSVLNLKYLKKIVSFCEDNQINLTLIRTPQHPKYEYLVNELEYQNIRLDKFKDVNYLDLNDFSLDTSDYADFGHLNFSGANKLSRYFNKLINEK